MRKGTVSPPDYRINMNAMTIVLKMKGFEQVFAGKTVAVSILKNLNLPV
jgi:hypothetical protein